MAPQRSGSGSDYADIATLIKTTLEPLVVKLASVEKKVDQLDGKVDHLTQDRVSRPDFDKFRGEVFAMMVPRDSYEIQRAVIVARNADLESRINRVDNEIQRLEDRFEERFKEHIREIDERFSDHQNTQLGAKDRHWMRVTQIISIIAVLISAIGYLVIPLIGHVRFQ